MVQYAEFCGWALARAHARSGEPAQISGYLGKGDAFDKAIAKFAGASAVKRIPSMPCSGKKRALDGSKS